MTLRPYQQKALDNFIDATEQLFNAAETPTIKTLTELKENDINR